MSLSKISEIRQLSIEEIRNEIQTTKRQLFDLQFQKATRQSFKPHLFKHARHRLAQLLLVETESQEVNNK
uniref:ribosomal protein L29 n=1 Tax=Rhodaphanes brevistipitata TaxID=446136 RepID=UPI001FCDD3A5|nr:ribosomal protein L29 [Rhodaphanes brevistipitata]UNJ18449.1 ribosomal protein L29 [Rhodaphanes brevistipitata]